MSNIRITGDGPKITATGSGSTVLVEISTGQHDPGSFSGVHNDLTGRSTAGAHVGTAVSIDPTGFAGNLDGTITNAQLLAAAVDDLTTGGGGGGAVDSVDGRTGVVTLDDLYQSVGVEVLTDSATLDGPPRTVITAIDGGTVTLPTAGVGDVGQHWHISTGPYELTVVGCDGGDVTVPVGMVLSVVGFEAPGPVYGWAQLGFKTIAAPTGGGGTGDVVGPASAVDGKVVLFDGTTGKLVKDSGVTLGGAASLAVGTTTGTVAAGDDARLSDARTPTSHNHAASEVTSGTLDIARIPTGTTSTTVPLGNDSRFTDSRTPTAHKTSHATGGSDELALDASQITTGTVPTARLGSGSASSTTYLLGDQTWAKSARPILTASRRTAAGFGTPLTPLSNYASTAAVGKGVLYGLLCHNRPETISELMIAVTATSLTGSQVVIVGAADLNAGLPGSLLWSESITVGTTTGVISKTGLSRALPEWCWLIVLNPNSNAGTVTLRGGPPSLNAMQILAPFSASVGNIVALASPYTSADTLPSSYSSYDVTAGTSSTAGRWGFTDVFPLISAVV